MRHLRRIQDAAVDLAVGVFDGAERLHWRIVRARTAVFAPIVGAASAFFRRPRAVRPRRDLGRVRISLLPRIVAAAAGLFAIVAISTALAPSSSNQAVPSTDAGVAPQKAPKSNVDKRAGRSASAISPRQLKPAPVRARVVAPRPAVAPRSDAAPATTRPVAHQAVNGARATRAQPTSPVRVTTPPPPAPQPVAPAPQPPPENDEPQDGDTRGPGGGDENDEEGGGGGNDEDKDKDEDDDKDKDKDKDKDEDKDEDEDEPPPPPDDEDDDD